MPETMYNRQQPPAARQTVTDLALKDGSSAHLETLETGTLAIAKKKKKKKTYIQNLRLFSDKYTAEPFLKLFLRPIGLLVLPPVLWAALVESVTIGFYIAITSNVAVAFGKVYHFQNWQIGLCYLSSIIGALLAIVAGGVLSDKVADFFTLRNGGIREPEMRVPAIAVNVIIAPLGLILYGVGINNELHWMVPTLGVGLCEFHNCQTCLVSKN
jgi:hypothetical protein